MVVTFLVRSWLRITLIKGHKSLGPPLKGIWRTFIEGRWVFLVRSCLLILTKSLTSHKSLGSRVRIWKCYSWTYQLGCVDVREAVKNEKNICTCINHDQQSERAKHSMDRIIQKLLPASRLVISPLKIVIITMIIWTSFTRVFYNCHRDRSTRFAKSLSIQYFIAIANTPTSSSPSHASSSSKTHCWQTKTRTPPFLLGFWCLQGSRSCRAGADDAFRAGSHGCHWLCRKFSAGCCSRNT